MNRNEIRRLINEKHNYYMGLPDDTPDEIFDTLEHEMAELEKLVYIAIDAEWDAKVKPIKMNDWFKSFIFTKSASLSIRDKIEYKEVIN